MYCDRDPTVLTWDTYDSRYASLADAHPWTLTPEQQATVEANLGPCPCGGRFAFGNPPRCPHCSDEVAFIASDREYFVIVGRRLDAARDKVWLAG